VTDTTHAYLLYMEPDSLWSNKHCAQYDKAGHQRVSPKTAVTNVSSLWLSEPCSRSPGTLKKGRDEDGEHSTLSTGGSAAQGFRAPTLDVLTSQTTGLEHEVMSQPQFLGGNDGDPQHSVCGSLGAGKGSRPSCLQTSP
jgi:hypothetical protein